MAIGDTAQAAGFPIVPDTGEEGKVKWGAQEINRTRDFVAQVKGLVPVGTAAFQSAGGISFGVANPSGGEDGDIYFKILT